MKPPAVIPIQDPGSPGLLLEALQRCGGACELLLVAEQSLKPGAAGLLAQALAGGGLHFCPASPHPDLELGAHGRWLQAMQRPPFGPGGPLEASAWGLAGGAPELAEALGRALAGLGEEGDWELGLWVQLGLAGLQPRPLAQAWVFQDALPSLEQLLARERRRGRCARQMKDAGAAALPAPPEPGGQAEVPQQWADCARALDRVPLAALAGTQVSGLPAVDLVPVLARAAMGRAFQLAFDGGWHDRTAAGPAWVARPVRRVAVVHPAYGGSLNLAQRSAQALERLGYEVTRVDPSRHAAAVAQAQQDPQAADKLMRQLEQECLAGIAAARPQVLWILAQAPLGLGALRTLRRQGLLTAYWFCEDYRVRKVWKSLAPAVDAFFPIQGGAFLPALRSVGAAEMPVLPVAAARDACTEPLADDHNRRLSFFGAPYANRVAFFEALADLPLELYGEGWEAAATPLLKPLVKDGSRLSEAQGFDLFRACAVNINLHSSPVLQGIDPEGDYVNPRAFEVAACGAFQLVDRRRDLAKAFADGRELATYGSAAELREQVVRWTADPEGRRKVALAGQRRVLAEHTYEHRLASAFKALGLAPDPAALGATIPH